MDKKSFWDVGGLEGGTVRQMHKAVNAEGFYVSETAIRKALKRGEIRGAHVGNRNIVTKNAILEWLGVYQDGNK